MYDNNIILLFKKSTQQRIELTNILCKVLSVVVCSKRHRIKERCQILADLKYIYHIYPQMCTSSLVKLPPVTKHYTVPFFHQFCK